ncbi:MAG: cupredoxin domain-containing protein [Thermoplasmatota archaeon]
MHATTVLVTSALALVVLAVAVPPAGADGPLGPDVLIDLSTFVPPVAVVTHGQSVTVENADIVTHTFTSGLPSPDGTFDSGAILGGHSYEFTAPAPGTYTFHCKLHNWMHGVLVVQ